jgi:3-hydroxybutyryl-CoA dehydrogenase
MWVRSVDESNPRGSVSNIERGLNKLLQKEKITKEHLESTLNNIIITTNYDDLKDCELVIEAISEDMDVKKDVFSTLDEIVNKDAILATNTSSLSITEIARVTNRPDKIIGMHFFNPVPLMKLVEVIKGIATSEDTKNKIIEMCNTLGKTAVEVEEAPGFVVNRILIPMINEAIGILADGVASAKDIDDAMKLGANHPMGPLALADLIGLDVCLAIMEVLYTEFGDSKYRPHPLLRKMVRGNLLGRKTKKGFFEY